MHISLDVASDLPADPFERLHYVFVPMDEAWVGRQTEPGMRVDNGPDAQLLAQGKLDADEIHRPDIVRPNGPPTVFPELCLQPVLWGVCS